MKKRITAVLLVLCMCFSLVPVIGLSAAAESTETTETTATEETSSQNLDLTAAVSVIKKSLNTTISKYGVPSVYNVNFYVASNEGAGLTGDVSVKFEKIGTAATIYLPGTADASKLYLSWDNQDLKVSVGKVLYSSGELQIPAEGKSITFTVSNSKKSSKITLKTMKGSSNVAAMFLSLDESLGTIDAMNSDPDHETECKGSANFNNGEVVKDISIKGRGNSTWSKDKKPYNVTFYKDENAKKSIAKYGKKDSVQLIKGVKSKKWSLIANYLDTSLLRNKIAEDLACDLGIGLETRFVDLYMNGEYLGNYLLTPKNDYQTPDGGYALENDNYLSEAPDGELKDYQFQLTDMFEMGTIVGDGYYNRITVKDVGDDAVDAGLTREDIKDYVLDAWNAVLDYDSEDYQNYFDLESWSKMYLIYEVTKAYDCFSGSILMHRDGLTDADKLIAGPAWDYDASMGRTLYKFCVGMAINNQLSAEGLYIDKIGLTVGDVHVSLLQELGKHASFMNQVAQTYSDYQWAFENMADNVYTQQNIIAKSADMNNDLWGLHHLHAYFVPVPLTIGTGKYQLHYEVTSNWNAYVNNLHEFVEKRVMYLDDIFTTTVPEGEIVGYNKVAEGNNLVLSAVITNTSNTTYQWQSSIDGINWSDVAGQTNAELSMVMTSNDNGTYYRCVVTNKANTPVSFHEASFNASKEAILGPVQIEVVSTATTNESTDVTTVPETPVTNDVTAPTTEAVGEAVNEIVTEPATEAPESATSSEVTVTTPVTEETNEAPTEAQTSAQTETTTSTSNNDTAKQVITLLDKFIRSKINK